jgi:hypothetical protein
VSRLGSLLAVLDVPARTEAPPPALEAKRRAEAKLARIAAAQPPTLGEFTARWLSRGVEVPAWVCEAVARGGLALRVGGAWKVLGAERAGRVVR